MNVQVTIKIDRESIAELTGAFREVLGVGTVQPLVSGHGIQQAQQPVPGAAPTAQAAPVTPSVPGAQPQTPQAAQTAQVTSQEPQTYSGQIAQRTQLPPDAVTGGAAQAQTGVPTSSRAYALDELAGAAMQLMDRGMQAQLQNLLAGYGVEALPQLPPEQYGNFATALRGMGAQI